MLGRPLIRTLPHDARKRRRQLYTETAYLATSRAKPLGGTSDSVRLCLALALTCPAIRGRRAFCRRPPIRLARRQQLTVKTVMKAAEAVRHVDSGAGTV